MPKLKDINVEFVSFVDRAAVRDPQRKSEPRRLLLWKAEDAQVPEERKDVAADISPKDPAVPDALQQLRDLLAPHFSEEALADLDRRLADLSDASTDDGIDQDRRPGVDESETQKSEAGSRALADALVRADVAKAALAVEPDDLIGRRRAGDLTRDAQAEYLAQASPAGYAAWRAAADENATPDFDEDGEGGEELAKAACVGIPNDAYTYRAMVAKSSASAQLAHLRSISPEAARAWEQSHAA
jgi:hypothetical protein